MRAFLLLSCLALPLGSVAAQEPADFPAGTPSPPGPLLFVACDGPAAFRQAFLATNVGGLLGADETEPLIRPVQELLLQAFGDQRQKLWPELRDYRGRMELSVYVRPGEKDREVETAALFRMTDDGETDLDVVAAGLTALLRRLDGEETAVELGDVERAAWRHDSELLVLPFRDGDGLVAAYASGESPLGEVVAPAFAASPLRAPDAPPLELVLDLQQVAEAAMHAEGADEDELRVVEAFWGLSSLRAFEARLRPAGPQVLVELQGRFDPAPRGLFAGFLPDVQEPPSMTHLVPEDCPAWKDGRLRSDRIADNFIDALAAIFHDGERKKVDEEMVKDLGYHVVTDLLAHLGDEVLWLGGPWLSEDEEEGRRRSFVMPLDRTCLVFEIDSPAEFAKTWPRARQGLLSSLAITPQTSEHAGVEIHGGDSFLMETSLWLAVDDGLGLMAFGDEGLALLEGVLDRRGAEPGPLPPAVQRVRRQAPAGFNGAARADLEATIGGQLGFLKDVLEEVLSELRLPIEADTVIADFEPYARLLARHDLDQVVTLTGYDAGTWTFRVLW